MVMTSTTVDGRKHEVAAHETRRVPTHRSNNQAGQHILMLSSSLLTDRMLHRTQLLDTLSAHANVGVWATSARDTRFLGDWQQSPASVESFPAVVPFKEFPYNYLRRLNEFTWDFRTKPPSRLSMMRHVRNDQQSLLIRALKAPAHLLAMLRAERTLEDQLEKVLLGFERSAEARERLSESMPDVLVTTNPFWFTEPAVAAAAKKLHIPTLALIPSWDNISTKSRMVFKYDGYLVWSEQAKTELHHFYPQSREVPVYVVGAPQFDVFFEPRYYISRASFCAMYGLRPERPLIVYALGSPNFLKEHHGAVDMAERLMRGELGDAQMLVRPHPIHDNAELLHLFEKYGPRVVVQRTGVAGAAVTGRFQRDEQVVEWINTFRHADVVVNLSSTVAIDAAIFDRPVVNLDYDPQPGQPQQQLIKEINHLWTHFKPVAESGGVWLTNNPEETVAAVKAYLARPELHRKERWWMAQHVCGHLDGMCGERMAAAVLDFARNVAPKEGTNTTTEAVMRFSGPSVALDERPPNVFDATAQVERARVFAIVPRGEVIRNFVYSGAFDALAKEVEVCLLSVLPGREVERFLRDRYPEVHELKEQPEPWLVRIQREILEMAHGRWLWSAAARERWRLRDREAHTTSQRLKRLGKKLLCFPLANRTGLRWLSKLERASSRLMSPADDFVELFQRTRPSLVFNGSHVHSKVAVQAVQAAQWLGIPTATFLFSWDNLTSQGRIMLPYDYYLVWNEAIRDQLLSIYDEIRPEQVFVTGTPQFDFHFRQEFYWSREEFCAHVGADPARPIVLYSTGMANHMPGEPQVVEAIADMLREMGDGEAPQLLVRVYPKDLTGRFDALKRRRPDILFPVIPWEPAWLTPKFEDSYLLTNTLRHAALGINIASTISLELCMFDKPVINVAYNPPGVNAGYIDVSRYYDFDHYRPIVESGAISVAYSEDEMKEMLHQALIVPQARSARRRRLIQSMFGDTLDGQVGARVAQVLHQLTLPQ